MSHLKCVTNREGKQETTRKMLHRFLRKSWIVEPGQMVFEHCNFPVEDLQYQYDIYIYISTSINFHACFGTNLLRLGTMNLFPKASRIQKRFFPKLES